MFERFTAESRRAVVHAQEEARLLGHDHVGSEHILLGLMSDDSEPACRALVAAGVTLPTARERVAATASTGAAGGTEAPGGTGTAACQDPAAPLPFTPHAKKVLERSLRESLHLSSDSIGTEHILLGLLGEFDGAAIAVLASFGVSPYVVRWRLMEEIGRPAGGPPGEPRWATAEERHGGLPRERVGVVRIGADAVAGLRILLESIDRRLAATEAHLARIEAHLGIESGPEGEPDGGTEEGSAEEA